MGPSKKNLTQGMGVMCGQAMMAAADTALVIALSKYDGMLGTTQSNIVFLKGVAGFNLLLKANVVKVAKTQAYCTVDFCREDEPSDIVAQVTSIFARDVGKAPSVVRAKL